MSTPDPSTKRAIATSILMFAAFMDLLDVTIVNVALPAIRSDLDASPAHLEWILGGYTLTFAVLLITGGRLGDIFGRQRIFVLGVAGFTIASLAACLSGNGETLVAARIVQGGFAALMVPQLLSTVQVMYAPKERANVFGIVGAVSGTAAVVGPLLGGWLITSDAFGVGWRSIFLINIPVGIVLIVLALKYVPNTVSERATRLDLPGVVLATAGVFLLVFPLIEGREQGWPAWIWAMFGAAAVVLAAFVANQRRTERLHAVLTPAHAPVRQPRVRGRHRDAGGVLGRDGRLRPDARDLRAERSGVQRDPLRASCCCRSASAPSSASASRRRWGSSSARSCRSPARSARPPASGGWPRSCRTKGAGFGGWDGTPPMLLAGIGPRAARRAA